MSEIIGKIDVCNDVVYHLPDHEFPIPPLDTFTATIPKGTVKDEKYRPTVCDMIFTHDQPIVLRDGVTIYADIFRPADESKQYPAIFSITGYGKTGTTEMYSVFKGNGNIQFRYMSGYATFEGPEPDYWNSQGYAVVYADTRGSMNSEGVMNQQCNFEGQDSYDIIEWIAAQDWCTGKVGMSGNSYLAMSQFHAASHNPPHLAAIAPWEGLTDMYRDCLCIGCIPTPEFDDLFIQTMWPNKNGIDDLHSMMDKYPDPHHPFWAINERAQLQNIKIPTYIGASWNSPLHTYGTFRAWCMIPSKEKWLRVHDTHEWEDANTPKNRDDLRKFFDHYLKGMDNGWEKTPKARVTLYDPTGTDLVEEPVENFPLPNTEYRKLYLNCKDMTLSDTPTSEGAATYSVDGGKLEFRFKTDKDIMICGYPSSHMFVSTDESDDMDFYMYIDKEDSVGVKRYFIAIGDDYCGAESRLRVSHREVEKTELYDYMYSPKEKKLQPNEIAEINTVFWPTGLIVRAGESVVLTVRPDSIREYGFPLPEFKAVNKGNHTVYSDAERQSYITIPVVEL